MNLMRFKFSRGEELKYVSHLDQQKMFQRAFRRSGIPMAYSNGFNPHPKLAFAQAMAVGLTSNGEYGDVELTKEINTEDFLIKLNRELPKGYHALSAILFHEKPPALNASISSAVYTVETLTKSKEEALRKEIISFMEPKEIIIEKRNKKNKITTMNIKPYIQKFSLRCVNNPVVIFDITTRYNDQKTVSPSVLLASFEKETGISFDREQLWRVHRHELVLNQA